MTSTADDGQIDVARLHGPGDVRLHRETRGEPLPGEVSLRVTAVGLCGSDLHWYEEGSIGDARLDQPLVLGHEFAGVIEDGDRAGERVVAEPADSCGSCELCLSGKPNLCLAGRFAGYGKTDGALRSVMTWPSRLLHPVPNVIGDAEGALLEPLGVALHALDLAHVRAGGSAAVLGCGPLGLLVVQLLRTIGAHEAFKANDDLHRRLADGPPVDAVFEVAGDDDAIADAITCVRPGGRVVLVGIPPGDRTSFGAGSARRKGVSLLLCRRMHPADLPRAVRLAGDGAVDLRSLISHLYPISETPKAFAMLEARDGLKVIVQP
jgi:L-iditol 2-dehydrogenase